MKRALRVVVVVVSALAPAQPARSDTPGPGRELRAAAPDPDAEPGECRSVRVGDPQPDGKPVAMPLCTDDPKSSTWVSKSTAHFKVWWRKEDEPGAAKTAAVAVKVLEGQIWPKLTRLMARGPIAETTAFCGNGRLVGGDARLDIFLTDLVATKDYLGLTSYQVDLWNLPISSPVVPAATYIQIERDIVNLRGERYARWVLAHEFFHTLQATFGPRTKIRVMGQGWWTEASATWAATLIEPDLNLTDQAPEPSLVCEYLATTEVPLVLPHPTSVRPSRRFYGSFLLPLFLVDRKETSNFVRESWKEISGTDQITALERTTSGLSSWWKDYALFLLNRPPYDRLAQLGLQRKARTEKIWLGKSQGVERVLLPRKIGGLSSTYFHVRLAPEARLLGYRALGLPADVSLQVLRRKKGDAAWSRAEDWSRGPDRVICRETESDRFDELLFVIANAGREDVDTTTAGGGSQATLFVSSTRPCAGWEGTHSARFTMASSRGTFAATAEATARWRLVQGSWSDGKADLFYRADRASVTTSYSVSDCACQGGPVTTDGLATAQGIWVHDVFAENAGDAELRGAGSVSRTLSCTCPGPDGTLPSAWSFHYLVLTEDHPAPIPDLDAIRGTNVENRPTDDGSTQVLTQSWDLHPVKP